MATATWYDQPQMKRALIAALAFVVVGSAPGAIRTLRLPSHGKHSKKISNYGRSEDRLFHVIT
jgi:hypothetical protein